MNFSNFYDKSFLPLLVTVIYSVVLYVAHIKYKFIFLI